MVRRLRHWTARMFLIVAIDSALSAILSFVLGSAVVGAVFAVFAVAMVVSSRRVARRMN